MALPAEPFPDSPPHPVANLPSAPSLALAIGWSVMVALGGGLACGWCISTRFGELAGISLAACGAIGGYVSRRITGRGSKVAGICQAVAIGVAYFVAGTCWIHWKTDKGEPSWWAAICAWPLFLRDWTVSATILAACAAYGAWCAYDYATAPSKRVPTPAAPSNTPP